MLRKIFCLMLFACCFLMINCKKQNEDLTKDITGEYKGVFKNNDGVEMANFKIVISKVADSKILVVPMEGNIFEPWETSLEKFNSTTITATIGQEDPAVTFVLGSTTDVSIKRAGEGEQFLGRLQ